MRRRGRRVCEGAQRLAPNHPGTEPSGGQPVGISSAKRSLRRRASAEAFDVLRANGSSKISKADLLKHAVWSDHEPHPRVVREVHQALLEARTAQPKKQTSTLKKISGIFSRHAASEGPELDDVVRRFEQAFVQPD